MNTTYLSHMTNLGSRKHCLRWGMCLRDWSELVQISAACYQPHDLQADAMYNTVFLASCTDVSEFGFDRLFFSTSQ